MNVSELRNIIERHRGHEDLESIRVVIPVFKVGCIGHTPCVEVSRANFGFDWERNSFIITPEVKLREIDMDECVSIKEKYEELGWTKYKLENKFAEYRKKIAALEAEVSDLYEKLELLGGDE